MVVVVVDDDDVRSSMASGVFDETDEFDVDPVDSLEDVIDEDVVDEDVVNGNGEHVVDSNSSRSRYYYHCKFIKNIDIIDVG